MGEFVMKPNSGSVFENDRKMKDTHPDFKGQALIDGKEYWVSIWNNDTPGKKFRMSMAFELKQEQGATKPVTTIRREVPVRKPEEQPPVDASDDIPF